MNAPHHHIFYQYVTPNGVIGVFSSADVHFIMTRTSVRLYEG